MTVNEVRILLERNKAMYKISEHALTDQQAAAELGTWAEALNDVPANVGLQAMKAAFQHCRFPVTLADLFAQLHAMQQAQQPSVAELWRAAADAAGKAANTAEKYRYSAHLPDGRTQGDAAKEQNRRRFEDLPPIVREWLGNIDGLVELGRLNDEAAQFRKGNFERFFLDYQARAPLDLAALSRAAALAGKTEAPRLKQG